MVLEGCDPRSPQRRNRGDRALSQYYRGRGMRTDKTDKTDDEGRCNWGENAVLKVRALASKVSE